MLNPEVKLNGNLLKKPVLVILSTVVFDKGMDFIWHGVPPNKEQAKEALHQLRTLGGKIHPVKSCKAGIRRRRII